MSRVNRSRLPRGSRGLAMALSCAVLIPALAAPPNPATESDSSRIGSPLDPQDPTPPETPKDGRDLLELILKAHGGAKRLAALKTLTWDSLSSQRRDGQVFEISNRGYVAFPDQVRMEQSTRSWRNTTTVSGATGWRLREQFPVGREVIRELQEIAPAEARQTIENLRTSTTVLLRDHARLQLREDPRVELKGKEYRVLVANRGSGPTVRLYIDPQSGRIARRKGVRRAAGGTETREEEMWDYRQVNGIWLPFSRVISVNGERRQVLSVNRYEIDVKFAPDLFDAPRAEKPKGSNP